MADNLTATVFRALGCTAEMILGSGIS